ncbi:MAG: ABC transporter substrate-binding protein [Polyangiales bacterium]
MRPPRTLLAAALSLAACSSSSFQTRPVRLVTANIELDRAMASARRAALEGTPASLALAERTLRAAITQYPREPLAQVARVLLVRTLVAQDRLDDARVELSRIDVRAEPDLVAQRDIAHGVLDARDAARAQNTADHHAHLEDARRLLQPLERTRPDGAETVEMSCAIAEYAAVDDDANRAVRTLARTLAAIERAETAGTPWVRTGLRCEDPSARSNLLSEVASRVNEMSALTQAIDGSVEGSTLRRPLALRLLDLARARDVVPNFLRYFADLPDDRATQSSPTNTLSSVSVVGLVLPLSGPRSAVGTSILRGAQLALERAHNVRIALEDEGTDPAQTAAALDRLFAQGARAVIGPTRDEFAGPAAIRAQSLSIPLFLLAVPPAIESTGSMVRVAAPSTTERAEAIAHAVVANGRSPRALIVASTESDRIAEASEDALLQLGVGATRAVFDGTGLVPRRDGVTVVFVGDPGREPRLAIARSLRNRRGRWVLDARSAMHDFAPSSEDSSAPTDARAIGPWVGVRAGDGFNAMLQAWCARFGESPDELALLAHDAAIRAAESLRRAGSPALATPAPALDPQLSLVTGTVASDVAWTSALPAAAARCPQRSAAVNAR